MTIGKPLRQVLAHSAFRRLWLGQIASQFGDRLTQLMLIAVAGTRFPGSTLALSKVMAWTVIPAFLVSPFAGAFVDRWDRRRTMLVCDLARSVCVTALPIVAGWPQLTPTYGLVFLLFAIACFFLPARLALTPSLVAPGELVAANSLMTTSGMIASAVSWLAGGFLVERMGLVGSALTAMASYLGSALCIARLHPPPPSPAAPPRPWALLAEVREGFQCTVRQPHARFVLGVLFLVMGTGGAVFVVTTVLLQQALGSITRDLGVFGVTLALGLFLGTVGYGRFGSTWRKPVLIAACLVTIGGALLGFAWGVGMARRWAAGGVSSILFGMGVAPIGIAVNTMIHEFVHDRLRGRVFSIMGIVMNAALLIGLWLAGAVAECVTPFQTLVAIGAALIAVGVLGLLRCVDSTMRAAL